MGESRQCGVRAALVFISKWYACLYLSDDLDRSTQDGLQADSKRTRPATTATLRTASCHPRRRVIHGCPPRFHGVYLCDYVLRLAWGVLAWGRDAPRRGWRMRW